MKAYIGVATCCGKTTAAMIDDALTTAKDVADFAKSLHKSGRKLEHIDDDNQIKLERCECKKTRRLQLGKTVTTTGESK